MGGSPTEQKENKSPASSRGPSKSGNGRYGGGNGKFGGGGASGGWNEPDREKDDPGPKTTDGDGEQKEKQRRKGTLISDDRYWNAAFQPVTPPAPQSPLGPTTPTTKPTKSKKNKLGGDVTLPDSVYGYTGPDLSTLGDITKDLDADLAGLGIDMDPTKNDMFANDPAFGDFSIKDPTKGNFMNKDDMAETFGGKKKGEKDFKDNTYTKDFNEEADFVKSTMDFLSPPPDVDKDGKKKELSPMDVFGLILSGINQPMTKPADYSGVPSLVDLPELWSNISNYNIGITGLPDEYSKGSDWDYGKTLDMWKDVGKALYGPIGALDNPDYFNSLTGTLALTIGSQVAIFNKKVGAQLVGEGLKRLSKLGNKIQTGPVGQAVYQRPNILSTIGKNLDDVLEYSSIPTTYAGALKELVKAVKDIMNKNKPKEDK